MKGGSSGTVEGPIGPPGECNGSQLRADAELLEDRFDLRSDGGDRDECGLGDLFRAVALRQLSQDDSFTLSQIGEARQRSVLRPPCWTRQRHGLRWRSCRLLEGTPPEKSIDGAKELIKWLTSIDECRGSGCHPGVQPVNVVCLVDDAHLKVQSVELA